MSGRTRRKKLVRTRRLSREESALALPLHPTDNGSLTEVVQQHREEEEVSCVRSAGGGDESEIKNVTCQQQQQQQQIENSESDKNLFCIAAAESDDFDVVVVAGNDDSDAAAKDDPEDDLSHQEFFSSSEDRQTVVHRFDSLHTENSCETEHQPRSWVSLIDEEEEASELQDAVAEEQDSVVEQQQIEVEQVKAEEVKKELPPRVANLFLKSFALGPPSWRAMGDAAGKNSGNSLLQNPKWHRAAVRAVQIQETQKQSQNSTGFTVAGNHVTNKSRTGNGGIGFDVIPPPPILPGGIPQPPPPPTILPPGPWGDPSCIFTVESSSNRHGYDTDSTEHSSSHSSVLVDMGKVVGVLRSTHQAPRPHPNESHALNNIDNNGDHDDDDEDEDVPDLDTVNENAEPSSSTAESMVLATRGGGGCATCAAVASGKSPKPGSGDLDDSLCGDPLMYATFVAPVHQYSTETEPSRQTSFNYPSRQPSFKQNSSEAEPPGDYGYQQQSQPFLGGQLPVPRCSSSGSADYERSDEVRDIYEEVPTIDRWPLPPLPHEDAADSADVCSVEVSQQELEQQLHMERMSFMSGSSANEEEEEEMYDEKDCMGLPPPPPPPNKLPSLHLAQPYQCRGNRELTPNVHDLSPNSNVYESYRPVSSSGGSCGMLNRQWVSAEDSDGADVTSAGTVRRKAKRERNKTTTGVMTTKESSDAIIKEVNNSASASVSPSRVANNNKNNSFKRAKPARNKYPVESNFPNPPTPPPPVPPHQIYYKSHTVLEGSNRPGGLSSHHVGRLASPDQFSESSASFHENEFIAQEPQPQPVQQHQKRVQQQAAMPPRGNDNSVTAEVHQYLHQQRRNHQQRRRTPPPPQFSNRDSVRESWMSSGSECQGSSGSPYGGSGGANTDDPKGQHHHHHVAHHHYLQHHQQQQQQQQQQQPRSALDWHSAPTNMSRVNRSHRDLLQGGQQPQFAKLVSPLTSSTTLPRPSRSVGNLASHTPGATPSPPVTQPSRPVVHYNTSSRSLSRESGSSSSRAGSRNDQAKAFGGAISRPGVQVASSRKQHARHVAQEGKTRTKIPKPYLILL